MPLPKDNLAHPVLITAGNGSKGSGFYLNTEQHWYLVTARHVLFKNSLEVFSEPVALAGVASDLKSKLGIELDCPRLFADGALKKHDTADVAVCRLGNYQSATDRRLQFLPGVRKTTDPLPPDVAVLGLPIANARKFEDVSISNDMFLFGYPTSLAREDQLDLATPLLRKGIIAGKTEDGRLIIDCPVYFGNSGGLVVEVDDVDIAHARFHGIGIAVQTISFVEELWSKQFNLKAGLRYENSGYAIVEPMDRVLELL